MDAARQKKAAKKFVAAHAANGRAVFAPDAAEPETATRLFGPYAGATKETKATKATEETEAMEETEATKATKATKGTRDKGTARSLGSLVSLSSLEGGADG